MKTQKIAAIITCFFPKADELDLLIRSVAEQVQCIFIVNNGGLPTDALASFDRLPIEVLKPEQNIGTAGGYNMGAAQAWKKEFTHVLLLDQDSQCAENMLAQLLEVETYLISKGQKVAVVGPYYITKTNNRPAPFIQHSGYSIQRIYETNDDLPKTGSGIAYISCSYVISSGSLISSESWEAIGNKNEGLFLDFTDIEWGLRAESKGYRCFGSFTARMYHLIGDEQVKFGGRMISLHSPLRHYYAFRNCVWLFKQSYIPLGTRVNYLIKLGPKLFIYSWFSNRPIEQLRSMLSGILDGILNKMGAIQR